MAELQMGMVESKFADIIWRTAPVTSSQLVKLGEAEMGWKRTTVHTVLRRLCDKGLFQNDGGLVTVRMSREEFYARQSQQYVDRQLPRLAARLYRGLYPGAEADGGGTGGDAPHDRRNGGGMSMNAVFVKLVNMSVAAGWLILAVLVLRLLLKKAPRWITCLLWAMVAVRLVCPISLQSPVSAYQVAVTHRRAEVGTGGVSSTTSMKAATSPPFSWTWTPSVRRKPFRPSRRPLRSSPPPRSRCRRRRAAVIPPAICRRW